MSDQPRRDPIRDLENFGTGGVPVNPLAPAEVRRLGDRRRTRRNALATAGVVAAVAAIAIPVGVLAGTGDRDDRTPTHSPTGPTPSQSSTITPGPTPEGGWRTDIPAGFPLLSGLPESSEDGSTPTVTSTRAIDPSTMCGHGFWSYAGVRDQRSAVFQQPEDVRARMILTYADDVSARTALATARDTAAACGVEDGSSGDEAEVVNAVWPRQGDGAEETVVVTTNYRMPGTTSYMPGQTTWVMARVGNAVYLTSEYGEGGAGVDGAEPGVDEALRTVAPMTEAMCIYAADPCGGPSTSATPGGTTDHSTTQIPSDFPISLGSPDLGDAGTVNGTPAGERMTHADPCDSKGILNRQPVDRLDYDLMGPEFTEQREVRTFASATAAQEALDNLATAAAGCPTEQLSNGITVTWTVLERDTGYASVTVARTIGQEGGFTWQYTRVGLAIFGVVWSGEGGSPEQIRINADELTAITRQVAPKMCRFTKAGC